MTVSVGGHPPPAEFVVVAEIPFLQTQPGVVVIVAALDSVETASDSNFDPEVVEPSSGVASDSNSEPEVVEPSSRVASDSSFDPEVVEPEPLAEKFESVEPVPGTVPD